MKKKPWSEMWTDKWGNSWSTSWSNFAKMITEWSTKGHANFKSWESFYHEKNYTLARTGMSNKKLRKMWGEKPFNDDYKKFNVAVGGVGRQDDRPAGTKGLTDDAGEPRGDTGMADEEDDAGGESEAEADDDPKGSDKPCPDCDYSLTEVVARVRARAGARVEARAKVVVVVVVGAGRGDCPIQTLTLLVVGADPEARVPSAKQTRGGKFNPDHHPELPIAGWPEAKKDAADWGKLTNCGGPPADKPDRNLINYCGLICFIKLTV